MRRKKLVTLLAVLLSVVMLMQLVAPAGAVPLAGVSEIADVSLITGEIISMRGETFKVFETEDGTNIFADYGSPVHFERNGNGAWVDIDSSLVLSSRALSASGRATYVPRASALSVSIPQDFTGGQKVEISNQGYTFGFRLSANNPGISLRSAAALVDVDELPSEAAIRQGTAQEISGSSQSSRSRAEQVQEHNAEKMAVDHLASAALFRNVLPNTDLEYIVLPGRLKENLVVYRPQAEYIYRYDVSMDGLIAIPQDDGSILLVEARNRNNVIFNIEAPYMYDANGIFSNAVKMTLEDGVLTVEADAEWINDADRAWPVVIDPEFSTANQNVNTTDFIKDTWVSSLFTNRDCNGIALNRLRLFAGNNWLENIRAYIQLVMPDLGAIEITNGRLDFRRAPTSSNLVLRVYDLSRNNDGAIIAPGNPLYVGDWDHEQITWTRQPVNVAANSARAYREIASGNAINTDYRFNITDALKHWNANPGSNKGLVITTADENVSGYVGLYSTRVNSSNNHPVFWFEYVQAPTAVAPTITSANNASVVNGTGRTFQVTATGTAPITYSLVNAPNGVTIDSESGLMTIAPVTVAGTHSFTVRAQNSADTANQAFTLAVEQSRHTISAAPARPNFGTHPVGYEPREPVEIIIRNTGNQPVTLGDLPTVQNWRLATVGSWGGSIAPGEIRQFQIRPDDDLLAGTYDTTITITGSNDASVTIQPRFTVESWEISATPSDPDFGTYLVGYAQPPPAQTITIRNTGNQNMQLGSLPQVDDWTLNAGSNWGTAFGPSQTRTFTIRPNNGLDEGTYSPTITISTTGNNSTSVQIQPTFIVNPPPTSPLTVIHGTLPDNTTSGDFTAGTLVTITAASPPAGMVFHEWTTTSNGVFFTDPNNASTTFTMPANDVTVIANYGYAVNVTNGWADKAVAEAGDTVTITATPPEAGARFIRWWVRSDNINDFTPDTENPLQATFTMPGESVEIQAVFNINFPYADNIDRPIFEDEDRQSMDIYYPANLAAGDSANVVLFIHGGGFHEGSKSHYTQAAKHAAADGFVAVTMNYRRADDRVNQLTEALIEELSIVLGLSNEAGIDLLRGSLMDPCAELQGLLGMTGEEIDAIRDEAALEIIFEILIDVLDEKLSLDNATIAWLQAELSDLRLPFDIPGDIFDLLDELLGMLGFDEEEFEAIRDEIVHEFAFAFEKNCGANTVFDMLDDVHSAVTALDAQMRADGITPKMMAIEGRSAGAHLAMFYAYTREFVFPPEFPDPGYVNTAPSPIPISHIINDVGPVDATDGEILSLWGRERSGTGTFLGITIAISFSGMSGAMNFLALLAGLDEALPLDVLRPYNKLGYYDGLVYGSPINYVTENAPPTLMRYAGQDNLVPASHGTMLQEAFEGLGKEAAMNPSTKKADVHFNLFYFSNASHDVSDEELNQHHPILFEHYLGVYKQYFEDYMNPFRAFEAALLHAALDELELDEGEISPLSLEPDFGVVDELLALVLGMNILDPEAVYPRFLAMLEEYETEAYIATYEAMLELMAMWPGLVEVLGQMLDVDLSAIFLDKIVNLSAEEIFAGEGFTPEFEGCWASFYRGLYNDALAIVGYFSIMAAALREEIALAMGYDLSDPDDLAELDTIIEAIFGVYVEHYYEILSAYVDLGLDPENGMFGQPQPRLLDSLIMGAVESVGGFFSRTWESISGFFSGLFGSAEGESVDVADVDNMHKHTYNGNMLIEQS